MSCGALGLILGIYSGTEIVKECWSGVVVEQVMVRGGGRHGGEWWSSGSVALRSNCSRLQDRKPTWRRWTSDRSTGHCATWTPLHWWQSPSSSWPSSHSDRPPVHLSRRNLSAVFTAVELHWWSHCVKLVVGVFRPYC